MQQQTNQEVGTERPRGAEAPGSQAPELTVLVVESDAFLRQSVKNQIEGMGITVVGEASDPLTGQRMAAQLRPDVLLLEMPDPPTEALELAEWVRYKQPDAMVLANTTVVRPEIMRQAMRAGAQDLLTRPIEPGQLKQALELARQRTAERRSTPDGRGKVIAVMGVGGGVGTTTVATNLAVAMARSEGSGPVVLVDFDFEMGSVPCFLDLQPTRTYLDLRAELDQLGTDGLREFLPRHRSGLYMLAGPQRLEDLDSVGSAEVGRALELCGQAFRQVIVDAGHGIDERSAEVLDRAERILLVTQLNVASLRSARRLNEVLNHLGYADEQVQLVANRVTKGARVGVDDVPRSVGRPVTFQVPNDYPSVIAAIDSGVPLVESGRGSRPAASFRAIARTFVEDNGKKNGKPGPLRRFLAPRQGR